MLVPWRVAVELNNKNIGLSFVAPQNADPYNKSFAVYYITNCEDRFHSNKKVLLLLSSMISWCQPRSLSHPFETHILAKAIFPWWAFHKISKNHPLFAPRNLHETTKNSQSGNQWMLQCWVFTPHLSPSGCKFRYSNITGKASTKDQSMYFLSISKTEPTTHSKILTFCCHLFCMFEENIAQNEEYMKSTIRHSPQSEAVSFS